MQFLFNIHNLTAEKDVKLLQNAYEYILETKIQKELHESKSLDFQEVQQSFIIMNK